MEPEDWVNCHVHSCEDPEAAGVDTQDMGGGQVLLSFVCESCPYGSLEDDFRWWVSCPECSADGDEVDGGVTENGAIWFECQECGASVEEYPTTEWDAN